MSVARVQTSNVAPTYTFIGRVVAIQTVQIVPRVTAFIENVPVQQGSDVKVGELLFQLQTAQYQAAVKAAQAQLSSAKAALEDAGLAYQRATKLNKQGFEAQAKLDAARATRDQDKANVLAAEANLAQAGLNLSYCTIRSPIAGRIGAVTLTKGNLVTPSTPSLATINQLDPIRVAFSVSERVLVGVQSRTGATPKQTAASLVVHLELSDGSRYGHTGHIAFLGNQVSTQTGTVSVYADFPNPRAILLPGAYVNVELQQARPEERVLVPVAAIETEQKGSSVLLVGSDDRVRRQSVTLGRQIGQSFIVTKGLEVGERVIVAGMQKVRPGETIHPVPAPTSSAASTQNGTTPAPDPGR
ncbi:MAG: efflux RND transporter periplasmic adaptor subunit [Acetobacteraceae bacterium]